MSMPNPADLVTWSVTGQTEQTQIAPGGTPVKGVQVFYTTGAGHQGSVFVPYTQYTQANVRNLLNTAAAQMDSIGALTSQTPGS